MKANRPIFLDDGKGPIPCYMPTKRKAMPGESTPTPARRMAAQPYFHIGFLLHDVSRMRRTVFDQAIKPLLSVRFSTPILPGETLRIGMFCTQTGARVQPRVPARDVVVSDHGPATIGG
jgi:hypothetical protein